MPQIPYMQTLNATNTIHAIINKLTKSSSASSEDEEKRRPFLSTLTSSLMLQESKRFDQ
jgi:hypothetical protein